MRYRLFQCKKAMPSKLRSILDQSEQLVIHLDPAVSTLLLCCVVQVNNVWVGCHVCYILLIYLKLVSLARKEQRHLIAQKIAAATVLHRQKSLGRQKSIVVWWGRNAGKLQGSLSLKLDLHDIATIIWWLALRAGLCSKSTSVCIN